MARPIKSINNIRKVKPIRLSEDELLIISKKSKSLGYKNTCIYIRDAALNFDIEKSLKLSLETKNELRKIGTLINQMAHVVNIYKNDPKYKLNFELLNKNLLNVTTELQNIHSFIIDKNKNK